MMRAFTATLVLLLGAASGHQQSSLRVGNQGLANGFVRSLAFKYKLRICNGFPSEQTLTVTKGKTDLTEGKGMPYKSCAEVDPDVKAGDKLEFQLDKNEVGTFSISDLPQNDATLLLVVSRHDAVNRVATFESHVFASLQNSQVAVIDTYKGSEKGSMKIQDPKHEGEKSARTEELRYDSVVAVNPGRYDVVLAGSDGSEKGRAPLVAVAKESYIVLRVGVEDAKKAYPQEVVVYPHHDEKQEGAARPAAALSGAVLALLAATLFMQ